MKRTAIERLLIGSAVTEDGCWTWMRSTIKGYGNIWFEGRVQLTHRVSYMLFVGPIPDGMTIDHLCFKPLCVNPAHLRPLSREENSANQRSVTRTHCKNGHEFTPENTLRPPNRGWRDCRQCNREAVARYRARRAVS